MEVVVELCTVKETAFNEESDRDIVAGVLL